MGLSVVEIYNQALSLAGTRSRLTTIGDVSREAELCNQWYGTVRDQVFRSSHWSFAKRAKTLAVLKERNFSLPWAETDPLPGWRFAYGLPSDLMHPRFLASYAKFELGTNGDKNALMSSEENPVLVYTGLVEDTSRWDMLFTTAVFAALAAMIARPLTGSAAKSRDLYNLANERIIMAREMNANDDHIVFETLPPWLTARGIGGPMDPSRYIYPLGPLFMTGTNGS